MINLLRGIAGNAPFPESKDAAIVVRNVKKTFGSFVAVDNVSFVVPRGTILGLLGPNGAGKTTIINMLTTLSRPTSGTLTVSGFDVARDGNEVRKRIGLAGQYAAVDENLTGTENLEMIGRLHRLSVKDARSKASELMRQFGLGDAAHRPLKTFSGGMRRRLDLAASLVARPDVLFLDEPTTGLDPKSRLDLWDILRKLVEGGTTILLTTQYLEEADALADRILMIDRGRVIAEGTPDELKSARGGDVLELHLENVSRIKEALHALTGVGNGAKPNVDETTGQISIPVTHRTQSLLDAVRKLDAANIALADVTLRRPTLDEVFLDLTGGRA